MTNKDEVMYTIKPIGSRESHIQLFVRTKWRNVVCVWTSDCILYSQNRYHAKCTPHSTSLFQFNYYFFCICLIINSKIKSLCFYFASKKSWAAEFQLLFEQRVDFCISFIRLKANQLCGVCAHSLQKCSNTAVSRDGPL